LKSKVEAMIWFIVIGDSCC